jgi:ATP-dependent Clp protease ATP-binding subunit ClpB
VDFKNTIIITTSNVGSSIIQQNMENANGEEMDVVYEKTRKEIFTLLKATIRPEFLNRIDEIIMFKPLDLDEIKGIARLQLENVKRMLAKSQIRIDFSEEAIELIAREGFDPQFGARPIKRVVQRSLLNRLSKMILAGSIDKESAIRVGVENGELSFVNS